MKLSGELQSFATRIGHDFAQPDLLVRAVTHPSVSSPTRQHNQRLEFLGDRVLNLVIAEALYEEDQDASEGQLAPRYNTLIRKETCAEVAAGIDLGAVLRLGRSEQRPGGRRKMPLLGDAMEAVIGAIYLDAGFPAAREVVLRLWGDRVAKVAEDATDAKTALQEWAQARGLTPPAYVETGREGPDHAPQFRIEARLGNGETAEAVAGSKRAAEQEAARALLDRISS